MKVNDAKTNEFKGHLFFEHLQKAQELLAKDVSDEVDSQILTDLLTAAENNIR